MVKSILKNQPINFSKQNEQFSWLYEINFFNFENRVSSVSPEFLIDQTMLNGGEGDGIFINENIPIFEDFLLAGFLDPILLEGLPFDKIVDVITNFEIVNFPIVLSEMQQHLSFLNVSDTDFTAVTQLLEDGFSPRPDHFAILNI